MNKETYEKLVEAVTFIENTAQNMQSEDTIITNEWAFIEADARELREAIEGLDYEDEELKEK
jgi:hypothetical protein